MVDLTRQIEAIKDRLPIETVVGQRVQLQRKGNRLWGLCPFHAEKSPSFTVQPEQGFFKCFGCGKGGDLITFVREIDGLEFLDALRLLADQAGVELPSGGGRSHGHGKERREVAEALARARQWYRRALAEDGGEAARDYLHRRGVLAESMESFSLGWAPAEPGWLVQRLRKDGLAEQTLIDAGLAMRSERDQRLRDRFWDRLMFPVIEAGDRTLGFGGRYLPGSRAEERKLGKYVNSPEGPLFKKRRLLYGADKLAEGLRRDADGPILVCEGYLDVILLHQAGLPTAVAALGTAFTEDHARRLRRSHRPIALMLDADLAGRQAAVRAARILVQEGVDVRVVELPDGKDPADLISEGRAEELSERVANAWDIIEWRLSIWSRKSDFRAPSVQAKAAEEMAAWVQSTPNPALGELWMRLASDRLGIGEGSLRRMIAPTSAPSPSHIAPVESTRPSTERTAQEILQENEREIVAAILMDPSLVAAFRPALQSLQLGDPVAAEVLTWCLRRRQEGHDCSLIDALEGFPHGAISHWLDPLRHLEVQDVRQMLMRSLDALEANRERLARSQRSLDANQISDADLEALRRPIRLSPNEGLNEPSAWNANYQAE